MLRTHVQTEYHRFSLSKSFPGQGLWSEDSSNFHSIIGLTTVHRFARKPHFVARIESTITPFGKPGRQSKKGKTDPVGELTTVHSFNRLFL